MYVLCRSSSGWSMPFMFDPTNGVLEQLGGCRCSHTDCLTLLVSLQTLSQLLGVFYVLLYWLFCIFSKTICVGTNNSLPPASTRSHTRVKIPPVWLQSSKSVFHHLVVFCRFICQICHLDVKFTWFSVQKWNFFFLMGRKLICLCPPGHSLEGTGGQEDICLA